jgi:PAS domain S-box-containing protein
MGNFPTMAVVQASITIGAVMLLWSLHARLDDRPVFKWWAWAWTFLGLCLIVGAVTLSLEDGWTPTRATLLVLSGVFGFLPPPFLVFGALSLQSPGRPTQRERRVWPIACALIGVTIMIVSVQWTDVRESYYMRVAPRSLALGGALLFCAWVFLSEGRRLRSPARLITGGVCLLYGSTQVLYGAALAAWLVDLGAGVSSLADTIIAVRPQLFWIDLANVYGSCIGLVLLLVEDYQRSKEALEESVSRRQQVTGENLALQAEIEVRRRAEQALQRSEEKFAAAFRSNPCAMAITLFEPGTIVDVNEILVRNSGYTRDELIGSNSSELGFWVDPEERASVTADLDAHGRVAMREVRWRKKSGQVVTVLYSADTIEFDGERCVLSVAEDITTRKQAEATHRAVLRALPDWMFVLTRDGVFLDFHARDPERLAAAPSTFLGRHVRDVLPPDIADGLLRCFEQAMSSDDAATLEYSLPGHNESHFYEARVVRCDADKVLSIVRDITERRRAELQARELRDELAHVGRVTTLAALTGSLAHEINQPLAAVMTNAQAARRLMAAPVPDLAELRAALADIVADNQRAAEVVKRLRSLLRKDTSEYAPVDVNDSIGEIIKVLQGDIASRRIALDVELAPDLPPVLGDRVQLQQVTLNLLMNAFEALERDDRSVKPVQIRTALADGMITVEVEDDGVGLTDEQLPRMFEPFYTTKPDGMGLGLAICQTILSAHDGSVDVSRNPGRGTTFSFSLPVLVPSEAVQAVEAARGVS